MGYLYVRPIFLLGKYLENSLGLDSKPRFVLDQVSQQTIISFGGSLNIFRHFLPSRPPHEMVSHAYKIMPICLQSIVSHMSQQFENTIHIL